MADQRVYARTSSQTLTLVAGLFCLEKRVSYRHLRKHPPVSAERGPGEIRSVREKGYAIIDEELEVGLRSLAVPVARSTGEIIAAVSVSAFSARVRQPRVSHKPACPHHSIEDAVILWDARLCGGLARASDPFHESRMYAMMHIAIHDALNALDRRFQPYAFDKRVEPGASPEAAVAAAARDVMVPLLGQLPRELPFITQACIDAAVASVETAYTAAIAGLPDAPAKTQGIAAGQAAVAAILPRRAADGAVGPFLNTSCPQDTSPGKYQCTPGYPFVAFEVWGKVTPFALQDSSELRCALSRLKRSRQCPRCQPHPHHQRPR